MSCTGARSVYQKASRLYIILVRPIWTVPPTSGRLDRNWCQLSVSAYLSRRFTFRILRYIRQGFTSVISRTWSTCCTCCSVAMTLNFKDRRRPSVNLVVFLVLAIANVDFGELMRTCVVWFSGCSYMGECVRGL